MDVTTHSAEATGSLLELLAARAHCPELSGSCFFSRTNGKAAGKLRPFGVESLSPKEPATAARSNKMDLCPVSPVGGYKLFGRINDVDLTFLLDTGAAVTLLRKEAWERILKNSPRKAPNLIPNSSLELVGADGSTLKTHGTARR